MQAHVSLITAAALAASVGCATARQPHLRVVVARSPEAGREPIAGATVRVECPEGVPTPSGAEAISDDRGEALLAVGIPSACFVAVERDGYLARRFRVADVCVERRDEPFVCTAGVVFAPLVLEGRWDDSDASSAAAALFNECFADLDWAGDSKPSLRLHRMINKTDEHINLMTIADRILTAVIGSPVLRILEAGRGDVSGPVADFHLVLEITSIVTSPREGVHDRAYTITARVIRATSTEIVCQASTERHKSEIHQDTSW